MTKKKMTIIIVIIAVIAVVALSAAFLLRPKEMIEGEDVSGQGVLQLVGLVEDKAEAEQLAADYGIELLRFAEGIATFKTDKTYEEIQKIGKEKGLTELSVNEYNKAF